ILLAGWLLFLLYAYPGYLLTESANQLFDARTGGFTDWHSPMMTEVWRIVSIPIAGPAGMLLLQSGLLLWGGFVLLRRTLSARAAAIAAVCILVFPPIMAPMAVITPEAQFAAFLIAGTAALSSERPAWRYTGLGLMVVACGLREGAGWA